MKLQKPSQNKKNESRTPVVERSLDHGLFQQRPRLRSTNFLIIAFSIILALPLLDQVFNFSPVKELFEKRLPVEKPELPRDFKALKSYPQNFEKFFNDNYGFRKTLISIHSELMDRVLNESPDSRAVVGKDGWLYFDNQNSLLDAIGKAQLSDKLVEKGVEAFGKNWQELRAKNIEYLVIIAADKSTVYPEFLPTYLTPVEHRRIDKFLITLLKKYPDFPVLDLRPIMKKAKKNEILYHQTDTHWNRRGAHYAYLEIMKKLKIKPHSRGEFLNKENEMIRGDISDIMNSNTENINYDLTPKFPTKSRQSSVSEEERKSFHKPSAYANINQNLPRSFIYRDSFFGDLFGFVDEHFSYNFIVTEWPCRIDYKALKNYKPNVVIHQFWEERIEEILKKC